MKKSVSILLSILMALSCMLSVDLTAFALNSSNMPENMILTKSTSEFVAPGITEEHYTTVAPDGSFQNECYVATIDFSTGTIGCMAGYKDYDSSGKWGMQTVRDQAKAAEKATGRNIVLAVNADYFNMSTGEPLYTLIMNGKTVKRSTDACYFAILKDGTPVIRYGYEDTSDVQEAVGSPLRIIEDGEIIIGSDYTNVPRAAIGITADGLVKTMVNDGRQSPKSVGYNMLEVAQFMKALGCVDALYLDGGGSATFCTKSDGTDTLTVKNSPSDGTERLVSDTLFFYSTAAPTGEFDHASISPKGTYYTKTCPVTFTAIGADAVGGSADIPEGAEFALEDSTMGSINTEITENGIKGVFTSSGKLGEVKVNVVVGGIAKGSTVIEVCEPDSISFTNDEISLGFGDEDNLGLIVKYKNVAVNYTADDIAWSTVNDAVQINNKFEYNGKKVIYYAEEGVYDEGFYYYESVSKIIQIQNAMPKEDSDKMLETLLGTFSNNIFTSSEVNSFNGYAVAASKYNEEVKGQIRLIIGKMPTVVMDFEDYDDGETVIPASEYWTTTTGTCEASGGTITATNDPSAKLIWANYGRDARGSAEIVDINTGFVRFGSHALKINFDFKDAWGTEGACIGFQEASSLIEGIPTGIGVWVYAPEGTPNLWLRMRFKDGDGVVQTVNFNEQSYGGGTIPGGIDFSGWKYFEADISSFKGPFSLLGGETFRPMYLLNSSGTKAKINGEWVLLDRVDQNGSIYIDNVQFVYGANTDDVDNPLVTSVKANLEEVVNGMKVSSNEVSLRIGYDDVQNKYTTGVNKDSIAVYVDGKDITAKAVIMEGDKTIYLDGLKLANGNHSVKVRIRDNFNNETIETRTFEVEGDSTLTTAAVAPITLAPVLGKTYSIGLASNNAADVAGITAEIAIDSMFSEGYQISFSQGFEGTSTYDEKTSTVSVSAQKTGEIEEGNNTIATLTFNIPYNTPNGKSFVYTIQNGVVTTVAPVDNYIPTFSVPRTAAAVMEELTLTVGEMIIDNESGQLRVVDRDGNSVVDATIMQGEQVIGKTRKGGILETDKLIENVAKYSVYAVKDDKYSFAVEGQSIKAAFGMDNEPYDIILNATVDSETTKNITWLSSPIATLDSSVVLYAEKSDYEANGDRSFKTFEAESRNYSFLGSSDINENYIVKINSAVLTGLKRNTEYVFKVGDTSRYSKLKTFTTSLKGKNTSFFILGDTQVEDKTNTDKIFDILSKSGVSYDFGIQTGDSVETGTSYKDWQNNLSLYTTDFMSNIDIIHVFGNHEYMGDDDAVAANAIYNTPDESVYSVQYGNVYVATMVYETSEVLIKERLEWIKEDAAKSNAQWKILTIHQPAYYTNVTSPSDQMNKLVPQYAEEIGIDMVFSGHDHSYARTQPLKGGEVDEKDGIIYMICGTTGGKSYTATNTPEFNFVQATNNFNAIYTTVEATEDKLTVKVNELLADTLESALVDEFSVTKVICKNGIHSFVLSDDDYIACSVCGKSQNVKSYTGFLTDGKTGLAMYCANGEFASSQWISNGDDHYYLGESCLAVTGENVIDGKTYTFDDKGLFQKGSFVEEEVTMTDGSKKTITRYYGAGGQYLLKWVELDGSLYHFKKQSNASKPDDGAMFYGGRYKITTPGKNTGRYFTFDDDGKLILGAWEDENDLDGKYKGTRYYWGDSYVTGENEISGVKYTFDENGYLVQKNISDMTITVDTTDKTYTGSSIKPEIKITDGNTTLTKGTHYSVNYKNNKNAGTASIVITGKDNRGYTGKIEISFNIVPEKVTGLKAKSGNSSVTLTWSGVNGAEKYNIYRKTNGKYTLAGTSKTTSYTDLSKKAGTKYSYKVSAVIGKTESKTSSVASATPKLGSTSITKLSTPNYKSIKLTWSKVTGAKGYYVYRSTSKNGTFKKIATVTGTSYTDSSVKTGTKYFYKIKAYAVNGKDTVTSSYSKAVSGVANLSATKVKLGSKTKTAVTLKWSKVTGATGYEIYSSAKSNGKYSKIGTITKNGTVTFTDKGLKTGSTHYYYVKAYRTVDNVKVYSASSNVLKATTSK